MIAIRNLTILRDYEHAATAGFRYFSLSLCGGGKFTFRPLNPCRP